MLGNAIKVGYHLEQFLVNLLVQVTTRIQISHTKTPKQFESGQAASGVSALGVAAYGGGVV
jgi:hypothetical protein